MKLGAHPSQSSIKGSCHFCFFRRGWDSQPRFSLNPFCLTIVFPNTLSRSAKQRKDSIILPAFSHMADSKTYTPLLQDVHIKVVNIIFFSVSKFLSSPASFSSFYPSFFLFFFLKHCLFKTSGRSEVQFPCPSDPMVSRHYGNCCPGQNAEQL